MGTDNFTGEGRSTLDVANDHLEAGIRALHDVRFRLQEVGVFAEDHRQDLRDALALVDREFGRQLDLLEDERWS